MKKLDSIRKVLLASAVAIVPMSQPVLANSNDLGAALFGLMLGAALNDANNTSRRRSQGSTISAAQREENRRVQTALNYFGFPVGSVDGVLGSKSKAAIANYQVLIGMMGTGQLTDYEKRFLLNSYDRAQAGGASTLAAISVDPLGAQGLLKRYHAEVVAASVPFVPGVVQTQETQIEITVEGGANSENAEVLILQRDYEIYSSQAGLLQLVLERQNSLPYGAFRNNCIKAIQARLEYYQAQMETVSAYVERMYSTPVRPANANLGVTAARASEIFPRVPYYIAGTEETGEMWISPRVTDEGTMQYLFNFMDPQAEYGTIRESVPMTPNELLSVVEALGKVDEWSAQATEASIRRNFDKRAACFPESDCSEMRVGNTSTEVIFGIYEDGSTAAKIQRNKGMMAIPFNFSLESARLLAAYLDFMLSVSQREFEAGTMTDSDLDAMFK